MIRTVGYGLLILALFDIVEIFVLPNFMNPNWEFQTVGSLVERVPIPLLGLMLVFHGEVNSRKKWEKPILKLFSWASLIAGVVFILLIPLALSDIGRLDVINNLEVSNQSAQQLAQLQQLGEQASQGTGEDVNSLATRFNIQLDLPSTVTKDPQKFKSQLLAEIAKAKRSVQTQAEISKMQNHITLLKNSLKWSLGAVVSAVLFVRLWQLSFWTRGDSRRRKGLRSERLEARG